MEVTLSDNDEHKADVFTDGEQDTFFTQEYIDDLGKVLGFDVKDNLDKVWMLDEETAPMIVEGDGFDVIIAPRIKPDEGWENVHNG